MYFAKWGKNFYKMLEIFLSKVQFWVVSTWRATSTDFGWKPTATGQNWGLPRKSPDRRFDLIYGVKTQGVKKKLIVKTHRKLTEPVTSEDLLVRYVQQTTENQATFLCGRTWDSEHVTGKAVWTY